MQVIHGLAAPAPDVGDEPIAAVRDPLRARDLGGDGEEAAEERTIRLGQLGRGCEMSSRDQQDVRRRPWRDVAKGDDEVVVVDAIGRDRAGSDATEQAALHERAVCRRRVAHHSTGLELIRKPIVPTSPAMRYDT